MIRASAQKMLPTLIPALAPGLSVTEEEDGDACGGSGLVVVAAVTVIAVGDAVATVGDTLDEGVEERAEEVVVEEEEEEEEEEEKEDEACDIKDEDEGDGAVDDASIDDKVRTTAGLEAPSSWLRAETPQV